MKKQGFTLIELMVVVVIIGILAAVAVPKLFGMIAKSKASEVGPAAGTYVKLQDAYVSEVGEYYGNWATIGYSIGTNNATNNFSFTDGLGETTSAALPDAATEAWTATSKVALNDCGLGSAWIVNVAKGTTGGAIAYSAEYAPVDSDEGDCKALTPNFEKVAQ